MGSIIGQILGIPKRYLETESAPRGELRAYDKEHFPAGHETEYSKS